MLGVNNGFSELLTVGGACPDSFPKAVEVSFTNYSWFTLPAAETVTFGPTK